VNRLRSVAHEYLLPLVISALVLRALIPVGFMPGSGAGTSLTATMCNPVNGKSGTEIIEIPGGLPAGTGAMHCDYCLSPVLAAAFAFPVIVGSDAVASRPSSARIDAPVSRFALSRAQIPRAPPLV
jgi:DUF2946 family protein